MPETPEARPLDDIAPLLRLGLEEDMETQAADPNATILVTAPTPRTGGSGQSGSGSRDWQPPSVEELQQVLPQYEISAFIARGGMGAVYKGMQKTLKRPVAIKVLPPEMGDDTGDLQFAARFKHEAQAMAQLSHPNIVAVFDAGETPDGLLYFVMEFIEGTDVAQLIASEGIVEPRRAIQITTAVCEALAFAHEEGIIHRDIKPSNIMIDKRGRVKVADFGLAKTVSLDATLLTGTNLAMGTPDFIAPEAMIPGIKVDQRADIYALGVMLYQMLTGTIPRGRFELPSGVVPRVDKGFDPIVDKAMQTDREKRYSTAMEMKVDVERVGTAPHPNPLPASGAREPEAARLSSPSPQRGEGRKSATSRKPLLLGTAAALILLGTTAFFLMDKPTEAEGRADGPPSAAARPQSGALGQSALPATTEAWINALTKDTKVALDPADLTPEGLRFVGNRVIQGDRAPTRDGALRMRTTYVPATEGIQLRVRNNPDDTLSYALDIDKDGKSAFLRRLSKGVGRGRSLGVFPLPVPLRAGEEYELELWAIGSQFTVKLNGQVLGEAEDTTPAEGRFGMATSSTVPVLVKALEYLNLDGRAASPKPPSQSSALGPSVPPTYPQPKQWVDATALMRGTYVSKGVLRADGEWLEAQKEDFIGIGRGGDALQNLAVRVRFAHQVEVHLRKRAQSLDTFYMLRIGDRKASISLIQGSSPWAPLAAPVELKSDFGDGSEHELVVTALGSQLSLWLDGTLLVSATDSTLTGGDLHQIRTKPKAGGPPTRIKQLEYATLEAVSSSPPLPVSLRGSAAKSSAPTWRKVLTKPEDLPLEVRGLGVIEWKDGWMDANASGDSPSVRILGTDGRNQGIRLHGKVTALTGSSIGSVIWLRRVSGPNGKSADYRLFLGAGESPVVAIQHDDRALAQESETLTFIRPEPVLKPGDEYDMELYAIGGKLIARFNGRPLAEVTDTRLTEGYMGIQSKHLIRDVEVINLDGLSEAEARKVAGLGE